MKTTFTNIVNNLKSAFETLKPTIMALVDQFKVFWERIQPLVQFLGILIGLIVGGLIIAFIKFIEILSAVVGPVLNTVIIIFGWLLDKVGLFVQFIATKVMPVLIPVFTFLGNLFVTLFKEKIMPTLEQTMSVFRLFGDIISWVFTTIVLPALNLIGAVFQLIFSIIAAVVGKVIENLRTNWGRIKTYLIDPIINAWKSISEKNEAGKKKTQEVFNGIIDWIKGIAVKLTNAMTKPFKDAKDLISTIAAEIKKAAEKISPFHKSSPSLVEKVQKGIGMISTEYDRLSDLNIAPISHSMNSDSIEGLFDNTKVVKQEINVNVDKMSDFNDLESIGRELGFRANILMR